MRIRRKCIDVLLAFVFGLFALFTVRYIHARSQPERYCRFPMVAEPHWSRKVGNVELDSVFFVVLTSAAGSRRLGATQTWLRHIKRNRFIIASDRDYHYTREQTWPIAEGKKKRVDGAYRVFAAMHQLYEQDTQFKWLVTADDDTWLNIPELLRFLDGLDEESEVMAGYIWDRVVIPLPSFSGGAGIVFSKPAFVTTMAELWDLPRVIVESHDVVLDADHIDSLITPERWAHDEIISRKIYHTNITRLHSPRFHPFMLPDHLAKNPSEIHSAVSFHYASVVMCDFEKVIFP